MSSGKKKTKETSIRFCGLGGMGVIITSTILGKSAIYDNKNAIQTQSYGPEQRGTKVKSDIIISEGELISYPTDSKVDILIAFSQEAYDFYSLQIKKKGFIFINSDLVNIKGEGGNIFKIPASAIARELKNERILNIVILGALIKITKLVSKEAIIKSIKETVHSRFIDLNINAFNRGYEFL